MSALECGVPWLDARRMGFHEVTALVRAHNDAHRPAEGDSGGKPRVRDASQSDIKKVFG